MNQIPSHDDIHVIALLGKALRAGEIGREFASRLQAFAGELEAWAASQHLYLAICGGEGESKRAFQYLREHHAALLPASDRCFDDAESRSTWQNFEALGRFLNSLLSPGRRHIRLTVVTTDYHVERIRFVDRHVPKQSLLQHIRHAVPPEYLRWTPTVYRPHAHSDPAIKWFANSYVLADRLVPLQVNLEGMIQSNVDRINPPVYEVFNQAIDELIGQVEVGDTLRASGFGEHLSHISRQVESLRQSRSRLQPLVDVVGSPGQDIQQLHKSIWPAIVAIRRQADPDAAVFDRFF